MIVGFFGQAESGKDTAADYLVERHHFIKVGFADPLKRIAQDVWDFTHDQVWGSQEEKNKPDPRYQTPEGLLTPRRALQILGTEVGRKIYSNTWVEYALRTARRLNSSQYSYSQDEGLKKIPFKDYIASERIMGVVISDVRFLNEIKAIHEQSGKVIRLRRAGKTGDFAGGVKSHASEEEMKGIPDSSVNAVIEVEEGIPNFHKQIEETLKSLKVV